MARLCPTLCAFAALALGTFGCSGQKLEGRWRGPLPYEDAEECVINLYGNRRFDIYCKNETWVGAGKYVQTSDQLRLDFVILTRRGRQLSRIAPLEFSLDGRGNELRLAHPDRNVVWIRRY